MKKQRTSIAILCIIGFLGIAQISRNPRFALFHTVDVLQLLASGMCFGVALAGLIRILRKQS